MIDSWLELCWAVLVTVFVFAIIPLMVVILIGMAFGMLTGHYLYA